jgi:hypothetical protein
MKKKEVQIYSIVILENNYIETITFFSQFKRIEVQGFGLSHSTLAQLIILPPFSRKRYRPDST